MKIKDISHGLKHHLIDTTAMLAASNPLYSTFETAITGMSDAVSMNARLIASTMGYLGMGFVFARGRDFSRKIFNITDKTKEKIQYGHDITYTAFMNLLMAPPIYWASGETDWKKIALGTGIAMGFSAVTGGPMGYAVDLFRDLTGLRKSERIPKKIREQKPFVKKGLATVLTAASIAAMAGIYALTPDKEIDAQYLPDSQIQEVQYDEVQYDNSPNTDLENMVIAQRTK